MSVTRRRQKITVRKSAATSDTDSGGTCRERAKSGFSRGFFRDARKRANNGLSIRWTRQKARGCFFDKKAKRLPLAYRHVFLSCFRSRRRSRCPRQDIRRRRRRYRKSERGGCSADWRRRRRARFVNPPRPRIVHPTIIALAAARRSELRRGTHLRRGVAFTP